MAHEYDNVVTEWYVRLRPQFLNQMSSKYSHLTLADAENLYNDTFIAVYENIKNGRVKEDTSWSSYIMRIGMNLASKELRKAGKTDSLETDTTDDDLGPRKDRVARIRDILKNLPGEEEDEAPYKDPHAKAILADEIQHLSEPCRSIIYLASFTQLTMAEIAIRVGYKNADSTKAKRFQCMKYLKSRVNSICKREGII